MMPATINNFIRDVLNPTSVYLLDSGSPQPGVFVWVGKEVSREDKKKSMIIAQTWLDASDKPAFTGMSRMDMGGESSMFKTFFSQFDPPKKVQTIADFQRSNSTVAKVLTTISRVNFLAQ